MQEDCIKGMLLDTKKGYSSNMFVANCQIFILINPHGHMYIMPFSFCGNLENFLPKMPAFLFLSIRNKAKFKNTIKG
jgi:hypothetical protein